MHLFEVKKGIIAASFILMAIVLFKQSTCYAAGFDAATQRCENDFIRMLKLVKPKPQNMHKLISIWKNLSKQCKGTGMYEFRMAALYISAGNTDKAKQVLESAITNHVKNSEYVRTELLSIKFAHLYYSGVRDRAKYMEIIHELSKIAEEHATSSYIYEQLATKQIIVQDWDGAINSANKALSINTNSWTALRALVIAYTEVGKFHESQRLIDKVIPLRPELKADVAFDYASAKTYVALGAPKIADSALKFLLHYHPEVKNDQGYITINAEVQKALSLKQTTH